MKCRRCPADALAGKACCAACLAKAAKYQRKARRTKKRSGLCNWCNAPALPGKRFCALHLTANRLARKRTNEDRDRSDEQ